VADGSLNIVRLAAITMELGPTRTACLNGVFYAGGSDGSGSELWRSDGTLLGTHRVVSRNNSGTSDPDWFTSFQGQLFFAASGGLFRTDGTDDRTIQVSLTAAAVSNLTTNGSTLYFSASTASFGSEPWVSDGTNLGTTMIKDINPTSSSYPSLFVVSNGVTYFSAQVSFGQQLWRTDGTDAGTVMVRQFMGWGAGNGVIDYNGVLIFNARETATGWELWQSDGTTVGTSLLKDIAPGSTSSLPRQFFRVGAKLMFSAADGVNGEELWSTDGTESGTVLVKDIWPGSSSSLPIP
jgi:trimeric autotransporter adhesin